MLVKKITFPTPLESIEDIENDNIDVFVELDDEHTYTIVIATYKNVADLMEITNGDFLEAGSPFIIVKKLTKQIIEAAIASYAEDDAYWLKLYHLASEFDINTLNTLNDRISR